MRRPASTLWTCASGLLAAHVLYRLSMGDRVHSAVLILAACLAALLTFHLRHTAARARRLEGDPRPSRTASLQSWLPLLAAASIAVLVLTIALL
ncbi:hypothetical protein [Actinomadura macra]|uniref:hypothetical protein n=1 Tax=Actinomadura macra TaxID=46164 RepID=UPI0008331F04|nr:hypothetical protein [Actinomadura macra]